jgi:hypothetical protein
MTINKALLGDTPDYHKKSGIIIKNNNNLFFNKKQDHVIKLVCTLGYSCVLTLLGYDQEEQGHTMPENMGATSLVMKHAKKGDPDPAHLTFTQKSKCGEDGESPKVPYTPMIILLKK